ncbi:MAG: hypothetical protein ABSG80_15305 [Verrucomicrobiota bacterium]|jgi:hypothetical protein
MKLKIFLCFLFFELFATAQTNQVFLERLQVAGKIYTNCTVRLSNPVQAVILYDGGGKIAPVSDLPTNVLLQINYDPSAAQKYLDAQHQKQLEREREQTERLAEINRIKNERERLRRTTEIRGSVDSIRGTLLILNATKERFVKTRSFVTERESIGAAGGGYGGYTVDEFDRQIAITNYPALSQVTIDQKIEVRVKRVGVFNDGNGHPIELWDCNY